MLCLLLFRMVHQQVAVTRGGRLFTKNTAPCKVVRLSIGGDACSLPVREITLFFWKKKRLHETLFQWSQAPAKSGGNSDPLKVA